MDCYFDVRFKTLFYLHPPAELTSGIRDDHIRPLKEACERHDVPFRNISGSLSEFMRQLEHMPKEHKLLIVDDLQTAVTDSSKWADIFQRVSHHIFLSIILINQNYFSGKYGPDIRRNCTDFVLFRTLREKNYISNIAADLLKGNARFLEKCFSWVGENVENSYDRYIVIDRNEGSDPNLPRHHLQYFGVKTNLFKDPKTGMRLVVYFPCSSLR